MLLPLKWSSSLGTGKALIDFLGGLKQSKATHLVTRGKSAWDDAIPNKGHMIFEVQSSSSVHLNRLMQAAHATDASISDE